MRILTKFMRSYRGRIVLMFVLPDTLEKPTLVNLDLCAGNVFVRKQEDRFYLTGMIDFKSSYAETHRYGFWFRNL